MKFKIQVDSKTYEVEVEVAEEERAPVGFIARTGGGPAAPRAGGGGGAANVGREPEDEAKACRSPLSGVVSQVKVGPGDQVEAEQELLVLEAMKMFTSITSPMEGTIKAVEVAVGDGVKQGQLLIEFE
ncbi:MAG: acetyl-CoA carboxylase biotin carboxyl carrier protein subunit [Fimbriimonadaceae bacterium]|nr:acetyl-CoA carboxylase biotin carboxyl carrier protein subunit [Fimbriimonadaceae bacterium]